MEITPVFDRSKPFGEIMHGAVPEGVQVSDLPRYHQNGHYFLSNGKYHSSDPGAKKAPIPVPQVPAASGINRAQVNTRPGIDEGEIAKYLQDPRAEKLLLLPRDTIIALMNAANGPVYAGEGSTQMMVAWLVKNTVGDAPAPRPAPPPVATPIRTVLAEQPTANADNDPL